MSQIARWDKQLKDLRIPATGQSKAGAEEIRASSPARPSERTESFPALPKDMPIVGEFVD
jgi:hypothetical protein